MLNRLHHDEKPRENTPSQSSDGDISKVWNIAWHSFNRRSRPSSTILKSLLSRWHHTPWSLHDFQNNRSVILSSESFEIIRSFVNVCFIEYLYLSTLFLSVSKSFRFLSWLKSDIHFNSLLTFPLLKSHCAFGTTLDVLELTD